MVKIKISYQTPEELQLVIKCLKPLGGKLKISKREDSKFKKAYFEIE